MVLCRVLVHQVLERHGDVILPLAAVCLGRIWLVERLHLKSQPCEPSTPEIQGEMRRYRKGSVRVNFVQHPTTIHDSAKMLHKCGVPNTTVHLMFLAVPRSVTHGDKISGSSILSCCLGKRQKKSKWHSYFFFLQIICI